MKMLLISALLFGAAALMVDHFSPAIAEAPETASYATLPLQVDPGNVVAIRELRLKSNVKPEDFERFITEEFTPTFETQVPGVKGFIFRGDRGDRKERYSFVLVFDSKNTRDYYYPFEHGGEASVPESALSLWLPARQAIYEDLIKYVDGIGEKRGYTDYVVLGGI